MQRLLQALAAAVCFTVQQSGVAAYSHISSQYGSTAVHAKRFSWTMPELSTDQTGLGGGIRYAIDSGLCDRLIGRFREQSQDTWARIVNLGVTFVDCAEIVDALGRAFGTWASNHKLISFKDMSAPCTSSGESAASCPMAEVSIDALPPDDDGRNLAAYVVNRPARGSVFRIPGPGRRTTSGVFVSGDFTIGYATMVFNTAQCWYLDNTFCAPLHALSDLSDAMLRISLLLLWIGGFLMLLFWLLRVGQQVQSEVRNGLDPTDGVSGARGAAATRDPRRGAKAVGNAALPPRGRHRAWAAVVGAGCSGLMDAIEKLSGMHVMLCLLLLSSPPLMYIRIYLPCAECYDVSAPTTRATRRTRPSLTRRIAASHRAASHRAASHQALVLC